MAWGGGKVYGDGGCLQGDDSPAHTASCTVTTLIMIFNPADASVASIVPANEGARGEGGGGGYAISTRIFPGKYPFR